MTETIARSSIKHSLTTSSFPKKHESSWFGRSVSASGSSLTKKTPSFNELSIKVDPALSELGVYGQEAVGELSLALREGAAVPVLAWQNTPFYPDGNDSILFQSLGFSTAKYAVLGLHGLHEVSHAMMTAVKHQDTIGKLAGAAAIGGMGGEVGLGVSYAGIHSVGIDEILHEGDASLVHIKDKLEIFGNGFASAAYGFFALHEGILAHESSAFEKQFLTQTNKVQFVKDRLGLDGKKLQSEVHKGKKKQDFFQAGLESLRPLAEKNLRLLEKHGKFQLPFYLSAKKVDRFVASYIGKKGLIDHGKEALKKNLLTAKKEKMTRILGGEEAVEKVKTAVEKKNTSSPEIEKIVLSKLKLHNAERWKKIAVYTLGALSLGLMCYFTAGLPFIILTIIFVGVAAHGFATFLSKIRQEAQEKSPPGRYDHWIPWMNIGFVLLSIGVSAAIIAGSIGTFGMLPLALGVVVGAAWIGLNLYHRSCINHRQENYMQTLLQKKQISLREFEYLCHYGKGREDQLLKALCKLPKADREAIANTCVDPRFQKKKLLEKLQEAVSQRIKQLEMEHAEKFWKSSNRTLATLFV